MSVGYVQTSEHSESLVELALRLRYSKTVRSERMRIGAQRNIEEFAVASKDGGANRIFFIKQSACDIALHMGNKGIIGKYC